MPDCWIFLLKRRRALSNVSFSPTRTSANPGFTSSGCGSMPRIRARGPTAPMRTPGKGWRSVAYAPERVKHLAAPRFDPAPRGKTARLRLLGQATIVASELARPATAQGVGVLRDPVGDTDRAEGRLRRGQKRRRELANLVGGQHDVAHHEPEQLRGQEHDRTWHRQDEGATYDGVA